MSKVQTSKGELTLSSLKEWYAEQEKQIHRDFFTFLRFPSISTDPAYKKDVRKTAEWVANHLRGAGLEAELWETSGHPVVFGTYLHAGKDRPTLLLYAHYDVQPIDPLELWSSPPFEPTVKNGNVYARGACDDKGQCFYAMEAVRAFVQLGKKNGVNIKFFIEGEEECGSRGTKEVLSSKKKELQADFMLVVDMGIPNIATPALTLGTRGLITMEIACSNSKVDLHSGAHGGIALNPNRILATLLATLWDASGRVAVPHFYGDVRALSEGEKKQLSLEINQKEYDASFGIGAFAPEPGFSLGESNTIRPTLEINGMKGGYTGDGFKTVIPAKATAKLSARLVPDQDPKKIAHLVADFLQKNCPQGAHLDVQIGDMEKAFRSASDSPIAIIAKKSYEDVFNAPCCLRLSGGSIPIAVNLTEATGGVTTMIGVGLDTDDIHAPNEHFGLDRFKLGFLVVGQILARLSSI